MIVACFSLYTNTDAHEWVCALILYEHIHSDPMSSLHETRPIEFEVDKVTVDVSSLMGKSSITKR